MPTLGAGVLGRYEIQRQVAEDAFGVLYEAVVDGQTVLLRAIGPKIASTENFIVRFELLKQILPTVSSENLIQVKELGVEGNVFYLVKELPMPYLERRGLHEYDVREASDPSHALDMLFQGVTAGLLALEDVRNSLFKEGIFHDTLSLDAIWVTFQKALVGNVQRPVPKIDGVLESFLYYGDDPTARLKVRLANGGDLFESEWLYPSRARLGRALEASDLVYAFGALVYRYLSGHVPRGAFPLLSDLDASIDPFWSGLSDLCMSSKLTSMRQVVEQLGQRSQGADKGASVSPVPAGDIEVPDGMALVSFSDKVELGSGDGPLPEQPRFKARIRPFLIDKLCVTNQQFQQFLSTFQPSTYSRGPDCPATGVSIPMVRAYLRWRSEQEGLPPGTYRLPTEYEWEAACRGVTGEQYPWGERMSPQRAHCGQEKGWGAVPVKAFPAARFGLYGMLGNVWEWTETTYGGHPFSSHREKEYGQGYYVVKGGCWFTPIEACRASARSGFRPNTQLGHIGFRCVRGVNTD